MSDEYINEKRIIWEGKFQSHDNSDRDKNWIKQSDHIHVDGYTNRIERPKLFLVTVVVWFSFAFVYTHTHAQTHTQTHTHMYCQSKTQLRQWTVPQPLLYLSTKDAIASMVKKLLHRCTGAHARVHVHSLWRVCMHFDRCCGYYACTGVYVKQALWTLAHTFAFHLATGCAHALMHVQFDNSALGNEDGGVQLV